MGNILNDIVDEVNIKPNKNKLVLKWVISIAGTLIALAFVLGQFQSSFFNRMDKFEETLNKNTEAIISMETRMINGFENVDAKFDKVYDDGLILSNDFQVFNNKQLELIIDYGSTNKDMLKRMLELNTLERTRNVENQVEQAKKETFSGQKTYTPVIDVKKITPEPEFKEYYGEIYFIEVATNDTTFNLTGATKRYIKNIDRNKYEVGAMIESARYPGRYDVAYRNKR